jgi:hypothetical protein
MQVAGGHLHLPQPDQIQNMAGAKIISFVEEKLKLARVDTDIALDRVDCSLAELRMRVDQMVRRIEALEGGEHRPASD